VIPNFMVDPHSALIMVRFDRSALGQNQSQTDWNATDGSEVISVRRGPTLWYRLEWHAQGLLGSSFGDSVH
jgi:hypothetical protein